MAETSIKRTHVKGGAGKFEARYGRTNRAKFNKIDSLQKATYQCPFCSYIKVKRLSSGIWQCKKCNAKFTSKAYTVTKTSIRAEDAKEMIPEQKEE